MDKCTCHKVEDKERDIPIFDENRKCAYCSKSLKKRYYQKTWFVYDDGAVVPSYDYICAHKRCREHFCSVHSTSSILGINFSS